MNPITNIETITPELAERYLQANTDNRKIRQRVVDAIARDMLNGDFVLTHQGIAFDADGLLIDGQHRLAACVKSGVPMTVMVTRGIDRSSAEAIDTGIKRTFQDGLNFSGKYEDSPALRNKATIGAIRKLAQFGYNQSIVLSDAEIHTLLMAFREKIEILYKASISRRSATSSVNGAALSALIYGESPDDIYKFFSVYLYGDSTGCEGLNIAAAYNWNRQVLDAKLKRAPFIPAKLYAGTQNAIWNFIHSENSKIIRPTQNSRYPVDSIIKTIIEFNSKRN